jgi:hypothetical protein
MIICPIAPRDLLSNERWFEESEKYYLLDSVKFMDAANSLITD